MKKRKPLRLPLKFAPVDPSKTTRTLRFDAEAERRIRALCGRVRETAKGTQQHRPTAVPRPTPPSTVTDPETLAVQSATGPWTISRPGTPPRRHGTPILRQPLANILNSPQDGLKGYVCWKAHKARSHCASHQVAKLNHCLYPGQAGKSLVLVPLAEMPQVLQTTAASAASGATAAAAEIPEIGAWVRVKRGRYAADLAQVVDNAPRQKGSYDPTNLNTCIIRLKLLPRLNFTSKDRAPPWLFDPEEASRYGPVNKSRGFLDLRGWNVSWRFPLQRTFDWVPSSRLQASVPPSKNSPVSLIPIIADLESLSGSADSLNAQAEISLVAWGSRDRHWGAVWKIWGVGWFARMASQRVNQPPQQFAHLWPTRQPASQANPPVSPSKVAHLPKYSRLAHRFVLTGPHANAVGIVVAIDDKTKIWSFSPLEATNNSPSRLALCPFHGGLAGFLTPRNPPLKFKPEANGCSTIIPRRFGPVEELKWVGKVSA